MYITVAEKKPVIDPKDFVVGTIFEDGDRFPYMIIHTHKNEMGVCSLDFGHFNEREDVFKQGEDIITSFRKEREGLYKTYPRHQYEWKFRENGAFFTESELARNFTEGTQVLYTDKGKFLVVRARFKDQDEEQLGLLDLEKAQLLQLFAPDFEPFIQMVHTEFTVFYLVHASNLELVVQP